MSIPAPARRLLDFIASKEAPHGYDTVFANKMRLMPKPLSKMTIDEAIANGPWRARSFGSSACGRYQFMTNTLKALKTALRLSGAEVMSPAFQDRLGYQLLTQRGYASFMAGTLGVAGFGLNIAREWASFPVLADVRGEHRRVARGQSYYAGDGLNKSLVGPGEVEAVLRSLRTLPAGAEIPAEEDAPIVAARVDQVPAPTPAAAIAGLPWLARLVTKKPKATAADRPGLRLSGDPDLWDVQKALRDRAYYTKGQLDGLDGSLTQGAVAQARKDNGLGDGGIDAEFLARLPSFPQRPVSIERANLSIAQAARHAPELFAPAKWLLGAGLTSVVGGVADGTGTLDQIQQSAAKVGDVAGSVQTVFGYVTSVVAFVAEHRSLVLVVGGAVCVLLAVRFALDFWSKVRAAFY